MNRIKLYISAGLFLLITAVKLFAPDTGRDMRNLLSSIIDYNTNYTEVVSLISGRSANAAARSAPNTKTVAVPVAAEIARGPAKVSGVKLSRLEALRSELCEPEQETQAETDPRTTAAVEAFLESQEAFSAYAVPENTSYLYEDLPFSYSAPISGKHCSGFGYRVHPIRNEVRFHYGTDIGAVTGEEIHAFADGDVSVAAYCDSYGYYIVIDHAGGWSSLYAHCSELKVSYGDSVSLGDCIALVGQTGEATGPHLHFELCRDGTYLNPEYYVNEA